MKTLLGQRIREQRRKKGWTMDKLAEKADLSVNYVGDLECGVKTPSLDTFIRIVEAKREDCSKKSMVLKAHKYSTFGKILSIRKTQDVGISRPICC